MLLSISSYSQIDSTYYFNSKKILEHYPKSKINAEDLYSIAIEINDEFGIIVPYELALGQAIIETGLGAVGVGKTRNNPYSINSKKGYVRYSTVKDGIRGYYRIMARRYLNCKTQEQLLKNFVNCSKRRYASFVGYEIKLKKQITFLRKLINK